MVISGDMLFNPHAFDTALIQRFFKSKGVHASKHREAGASKLTHMLDRRRCVVLLPPGRRGEHTEPRHPRARPQHMPRAEVLRETRRPRCLFPHLYLDCPISTRPKLNPHLTCISIGVTQSRLASVVFYLFKAATLGLIDDYLKTHTSATERSIGSLMQWLVPQVGLVA